MKVVTTSDSSALGLLGSEFVMRTCEINWPPTAVIDNASVLAQQALLREEIVAP